MATGQDKGIRTDVYQATMLHECFADPLNVVILVKTNLESGVRAHAVLFSSDLKLTHDTLIHYYRLRSKSSSTSATLNNSGAWRTS